MVATETATRRRAVAIPLDGAATALVAAKIALAHMAMLFFFWICLALIQALSTTTDATRDWMVSSATGLAVSAIVVAPLLLISIGALRPLVAVAVLTALVLYDLRFSGETSLLSSISDPESINWFVPTLGLLLYAPITALFVDRRTRKIARPLPIARTYRSLLRVIFQLRPGFRLSVARSALIALTEYFALMFWSVHLWLSLVIVAAVISALPGLLAEPWETLVVASILIVLFPVVPAIWLGSRWLSNILRSRARSLTRQSYESLVTRDIRPPILFLRSFADDQVTLGQNNFWRRTLTGEPKTLRLDHLLIENFSRFGPVVAIGRPGERDLPYGAARHYVDDEIWRERVLELADSALCIVIVADSTDGIAWETRAMLGERYLSKTLFLASPGEKSLADNSTIADWCRANGVAKGERAPSLLGLFLTRTGDACLLLAKRKHAEIYQVMLQAFFRTIVV
ncbi:MAG: hypothetical protein AB7P07_07825 [Hyphomonadaceae bacterium]